MSARAFLVTFITAHAKQTRSVIHHSSIGAIRAALATFDEPEGVFALTCVPLPGLCADEPIEEQPCAA